MRGKKHKKPTIAKSKKLQLEISKLVQIHHRNRKIVYRVRASAGTRLTFSIWINLYSHGNMVIPCYRIKSYESSKDDRRQKVANDRKCVCISLESLEFRVTISISFLVSNCSLMWVKYELKEWSSVVDCLGAAPTWYHSHTWPCRSGTLKCQERCPRASFVFIWSLGIHLAIPRGFTLCQSVKLSAWQMIWILLWFAVNKHRSRRGAFTSPRPRTPNTFRRPAR